MLVPVSDVTVVQPNIQSLTKLLATLQPGSQLLPITQQQSLPHVLTSSAELWPFWRWGPWRRGPVRRRGALQRQRPSMPRIHLWRQAQAGRGLCHAVLSPRLQCWDWPGEYISPV